MGSAPSEGLPKRSGRRRLWLKLGIGSLAVLIALCTWLGVRVHRARCQRLAVEAIQRLGGTAFYDYQIGSQNRIDFNIPDAVPPEPHWLTKVVGEDLSARVTHVVLSRLSDIRDADLACLRDLPWLKFVDLRFTDVSDECLAHLRSLNQLECVLLTSPKVTATGLEHLRTLDRLEVLWLIDAKIGDEDLPRLLDLPRLEVLVVTTISEEAANDFMRRRARPCEVVCLNSSAEPSRKAGESN